MRGAPHRRHGSLFRRVMLHGLMLLFLVAVAVAMAGWALHRALPGGGNPHGVVGWAAERAGELASDPPRLASELRRARAELGVDATVYAPDGRVLATGVEPPLAPPDAGGRRIEAPTHLGGRGFTWAAPLPGGRGTLVVSGTPGTPPLARIATFLGAVLVALALGSIPLARSIAAPLERLTAAARALGGGDLSARARLRARGELGELALAFDEMAERVERLVRSERELLANVSHEIRTPLARIRVALELAREGDHERARRHLDGIGGDLDELDRLVEAVLAAARLDAAAAGGLPLRRERVDVAALVEDVAARFRAAAPVRTLEVQVDPGLPPLHGDPELLRRLLGNLLDNARKYSEAPAPVALSAHASAPTQSNSVRSVTLAVADRGIGIDPADLPRIFTPFFRTDRSRARGTGGFGLGLALAKRIAEAHGGTLTAESTPGDGTVVTARLPTIASSDPE